ncbi:MAG: PilZ domain-containing protein [Pseudomonadota bacterium]
MQSRKYTRYPTDIPIKFTSGNMIGEHQVCLQDAGRGGLCLRGAGWIEPGTNINICIPFSDAPCKTSGTIIWSHPGEKGDFLMGIEFQDIVNQSSIEEIILIERFKNKQCVERGIRMTSEEAAKELGAIL